MTQHIRMGITMLFLLIFITGCAHEAEPMVEAKTLKAEEWPTPIQATPLPTSTPFPKIKVVDSAAKATEAPTTTETISSTAETTSTTSSLSPAVMQVIVKQLGAEKVQAIMQQALMGATPAEILTGLDPTDLQAILKQLPPADVQAMVEQLDPAEKELLMSQFSSRVSGLPLVATGVVMGDKIATYSKASASSAQLDARQAGDIVGILGRNQSGEWIYTFNTKANYGWLPIASVRIIGDAAKIPVVPDNTAQPSLAKLLAASGNDTAAKPTTATTQTTTTKPATTTIAPALADLKAVTTATLDKPLNLQQGPGSAYGLMATVAQTETLEVLAHNLSKQWLLVRTTGGQYGWALPTQLKLAGAVESFPVVSSARPSANILPGQLAPISGMSRQTTPVVTTTNSAPQSSTVSATTNVSAVAAAPVIYTTDGQPLATPSLGQVAVAKLGQSEVLMRLGPGPDYGELAKLTADDELFYLLGVDSNRQSALVKRSSWDKPEYGWVTLSELKLNSGDVTAAPQIVTTWTTGNNIEVREGPGLTYNVAGHLGNQTLVHVYGIFKDRSWLLVQPVSGGGLVWLSRRFVATNDALATVPEITAPQMAVDQQAVANATFSKAQLTPQGLLVFQRSSGGDIMVINADGTGLRRLTNGLDPVLSPNGQQVAFTRWEGTMGSLWVMNVDGTGERQIIGGMNKAKGAEWSPDGSQIMLNYETEYLNERQQCAALSGGRSPRPPREGKNIEVKLRNFKPFLCWTMPPKAQWSLRMIKVADGTYLERDGGFFPFRPTWNAAQPWRVVYDGGEGLAELDVTKNSNQALTDVLGDGSPVFSPDGNYLLTTLSNNGGGSGQDIYRLNGDGNGRIRLTQTPMFVTADPDTTKSWNNVAATWSPDGQLIAFLTDRNGSWELWVMNNDGSDQRPMFSAEVMSQLNLQYKFVDERVVSWR